MEKMSQFEINDIMEDMGVTLSDPFCYTTLLQTTPPDGVRIEVAASEGGHEGGGEYCMKVFSVEREGRVGYVKFEGFYSSYEGSEYENGGKIVEPYEKTATAWREI